MYMKRTNLSANDLASAVEVIIKEKNLPIGGYCQNWCVAILLLANDADDYSLVFADESTCEDSGEFIMGAECHFWLVSNEGDVIDPTASQFLSYGIPLPYEYLGENETKTITNLSKRLIESADEYITYFQEHLLSTACPPPHTTNKPLPRKTLTNATATTLLDDAKATTKIAEGLTED
jgi:hypothetical protein